MRNARHLQNASAFMQEWHGKVAGHIITIYGN